jgi:hypothetical protein
MVVPVLLHAQYLEPGDIDIFINGQEAFAQKLKEDAKGLSVIGWLGFANRMKRLGDGFNKVYEGTMTGQEFGRFQKTYREFVDSDGRIPEAFQAGIQKMGFPENGHQKYWTIVFGAAFFTTLEEKNISGGGREQAAAYMAALIDPGDLEIIRNRVEDIRNMQTQSIRRLER